MQARHTADSQNCTTNMDPQAKPHADNASRDKTSIPNFLNFNIIKTHTSDYLHSCDNKEADRRVSEIITNRIHNEFNDLFSGKGCFESKFSLPVREGNSLYQAPPRNVVSALQKPLKEEMVWLQKQQMIVLLSVEETLEWCNSFV